MDKPEKCPYVTQTRFETTQYFVSGQYYTDILLVQMLQALSLGNPRMHCDKQSENLWSMDFKFP